MFGGTNSVLELEQEKHKELSKNLVANGVWISKTAGVLPDGVADRNVTRLCYRTRARVLYLRRLVSRPAAVSFPITWPVRCRVYVHKYLSIFLYRFWRLFDDGRVRFDFCLVFRGPMKDNTDWNVTCPNLITNLPSILSLRPPIEHFGTFWIIRVENVTDVQRTTDNQSVSLVCSCVRHTFLSHHSIVGVLEGLLSLEILIACTLNNNEKKELLKW